MVLRRSHPRWRRGVEVKVRPKVLIFAIVLASVPTEFASEYLFNPSDAWSSLSDAVARVRFESHHPLHADSGRLTLHTAVILGTFKRDPHLPQPADPVAVMEPRGFMQSEDGYWPCWDNEQPLPVGTEAMVFVHWDPDLRAFRLVTIAAVRFGDRIIRMSSVCE